MEEGYVNCDHLCHVILAILAYRYTTTRTIA